MGSVVGAGESPASASFARPVPTPGPGLGYRRPVRLPQTVGDYTLLEQIGSGSFGTVYRARVQGDLGFSQEVALKLVDARMAEGRPDVIHALVDEASFLARLAHPHIVAVRRYRRVDHGFLGEVHLMEMELVRGVPLRQLLAAQASVDARLSVDAVLSLLLEAVDALVYAHDLKDADGRPAGLVHRDLKPDNLLVGRDGRLKVLDFGIAWAEERVAETTATGMAKGTPIYMAPEQARGAKADPRGDLYALGAIAFECLTGERYVKVPGTGRVELPLIVMAVATARFEDRREFLESVLTAPAPKGHGLTPAQAAPVVELLGRMLAADIEERPASARVVAHDLDELLSDWRPHLGRRALRTLVEELMPAPVDPSAATVVSPVDDALPAPVDGEGTATRPSPVVEPTRLAPPAAPASSGRPLLFLGVALLVLGLGLWWFLGRGGEPADPDPEVAADPTPEATPEVVSEEPEPTADPTPEPTPEPPPAPRPVVARPEPTPAPPAVWPRLAQTPPRLYSAGAELTWAVTRSGGDVDCRPELHLRPSGGGPTRTRPMTGSGERWSVTMSVPYDESWLPGADYWIRCCLDGVCGAQLGSQAAPFPLRPSL